MPSFLHLKQGMEDRQDINARRIFRALITASTLSVALVAQTAMAQGVPSSAQAPGPQTTGAQPAADPIAAFAGQTAVAPTAAGPATEPANAAPSDDESSDAVSRFLNEKGFMDTEPVSKLARRVKDKAANMASDLVISAMDFLGVRYRMGGQSAETGFDCSGFTRHVFERSLGLVLPRRAAEQATMPGLMQVNQAELKPGDLVFFNTMRRTFSHVGIYVGDNKFIHSPRSGGAVRVEDMRLSYWQQRFDGARRVPALTAKLPAIASNRTDAP
jgi:cell wall-associated NlpC family hydrolase